MAKSSLLLTLTLIICSALSIKATSPRGTCTATANNEPESNNLVPERREVYGGGRIFDTSHQYTANMPSWASTEGLGQLLCLTKSMKNGSEANFSEMKMATHTGTHVDAPGHVFDAGFDVDTLDLEVLNGPALLVDFPRNKNLTAEVMKSLDIPKGVHRVLFRTLNTDRYCILSATGVWFFLSLQTYVIMSTMEFCCILSIGIPSSRISGMAFRAYVVYRGRKPRVYLNWPGCLSAVSGYSGALYKAFMSVAEAEESYELWVCSEVARKDREEFNNNEDVKVNDRVFDDHAGPVNDQRNDTQGNNDPWAFTRDLINTLIIVIILKLLVVLFFLSS